MNYMGEVFRELRQSRKISLKDATGGEFSYSMLSKFEKGESDLTISKLLTALENIHTELDEFTFLVNGFKQTPYNELQDKIWKAIESRDMSQLQTLYELELLNYRMEEDQKYLLNALVIKAHFVILDPEFEVTNLDLEVLYDYLFFIDIWGEFELRLFSDIAPLLPLDLYYQYCREMLQKVDYLGAMPKNRNYVQTILLNGLFKAIDSKQLVKAAYFDQQIRKNFFEENETYLRIVYRFADGAHDRIKGNEAIGLKKMEEAVEILNILDCSESAKYYASILENFI
ncbi:MULTISPECIES: Rgg/GadR/MutR family transcriptional regulator [unclassified Streptococcus]|uniref:Rgg/GadR/MutR family transcriptional regulator n=1 Tax=unclassified Streptococcus TaxID=2608887 RepID=UPI0018AC8D85|nr:MULTISPECIES: Rgg/GadR/MutR family transcriptional regulator [unclassified Streptococcus]MBF8969537.1 Rgg/GadR/MutR family transcriptional regulator [Streptococcus sp. NLN76]MBG9366917.1 Rgg/GadR/MutR family transcriptional regulator [Streptococcus sp. NLN64]MBJ6745129.1 Rgg/GadR/MutR family transcriptional regulator [Streptococcus sp. 121]